MLVAQLYLRSAKDRQIRFSSEMIGWLRAKAKYTVAHMSDGYGTKFELIFHYIPRLIVFTTYLLFIWEGRFHPIEHFQQNFIRYGTERNYSKNCKKKHKKHSLNLPVMFKIWSWVIYMLQINLEEISYFIRSESLLIESLKIIYD